MGFRGRGIPALFAFVALQCSGLSDGYKRNIRWPTVDEQVSVNKMTVKEYRAFRKLDVLPEPANRSDVFVTIRDATKGTGMFALYKNCTEDEREVDEALARIYGKAEATECVENCYSYYNRYNFGSKVVYRTTRLSSFAKYFTDAMIANSDFGEFFVSPFTLECRPGMKELKETIRTANDKISECLKNNDELKKNQEGMRKALDMQDATLEQLKTALKALNIKMDETSQELDGLEVRLSNMAVQMEKTDVETRTNELHEMELSSEYLGYRQRIRNPLLNTHEYAELYNRDDRDEWSKIQMQKVLTEACNALDPTDLAMEMVTRYFSPTTNDGKEWQRSMKWLPLTAKGLPNDVEAFCLFYNEIASDMVLLMTVFGECMAVSTDPDRYTVRVRDKVLENLVKIMDAFRLTADLYTNVYMSGWKETSTGMAKPNPKLELPTITNLLEKLKSPNVDLEAEARLRKTALPMYDIRYVMECLKTFRTFAAAVPRGPESGNDTGYISPLDIDPNKDYKANWVFKLTTPRYAKAGAFGEPCKTSSNLACNVAVGFAPPIEGDGGENEKKRQELLDEARDCYYDIATDVADEWTSKYAESDKWKFTVDNFYTRVPEIFAELDSSAKRRQTNLRSACSAIRRLLQLRTLDAVKRQQSTGSSSPVAAAVIKTISPAVEPQPNVRKISSTALGCRTSAYVTMPQPSQMLETIFHRQHKEILLSAILNSLLSICI